MQPQLHPLAPISHRCLDRWSTHVGIFLHKLQFEQESRDKRLVGFEIYVRFGVGFVAITELWKLGWWLNFTYIFCVVYVIGEIRYNDPWLFYPESKPPRWIRCYGFCPLLMVKGASIYHWYSLSLQYTVRRYVDILQLHSYRIFLMKMLLQGTTIKEWWNPLNTGKNCLTFQLISILY